jgi:hypothetical protein
MKKRYLLLVITILFLLPTVLAQTISVIPSSQTLTLGDTITIEIQASGVTDLYGMQFDLSFDETKLQYISITEGQFLQSGASTFEVGPTSTSNGLIDNYAITRLSPATTGVDGSGVLATIEFQALAIGTSSLTLSDTLFSDSSFTSISHTTQPGSVTINPSCTPTGISESICNGVDDDCDNEIDENYVGLPTTCGQGECAATGLTSCVGGQVQDSCTPGDPVAETCNLLDDNCDGSVDETAADCTGLTSICLSGQCVECVTDADCDNGLFCDGVETCNLNVCQSGSPPADDGITCTIDNCVEATQEITNTPDHTQCQNGLYCDGSEICDPILNCQPGIPVVPDDGIACTTDSCDETIDSIINLPDNSLCDNSLFCDGSEICHQTLGCQDQADPCTLGQTCDEQENQCNAIPGFCQSDQDCNDDLFCNGIETCVSNQCQSGTPPTTDDGITCTIDSCDETTDTILNTPTDSICDNNLFCDGIETCDAQLDCLSDSPPTTDDGITCTIDSCNEVTDEVQNIPVDSLCDNNLFCDGVETCSPTLDCQPGSLVQCPPGEECNENKDQCEAIIGTCIISSVSWSTSSANQDETANLNVEGTPDCDGKIVSFIVKEYDTLLNPHDDVETTPSSVSFIGTTATGSWVAEFQEDVAGDPEYYFIATTEGVPYETGKGEQELLSVQITRTSPKTISLPLQTGKNLISFPIIVEDPSVESVFASIEVSADTLYTYDNGWKVHHFDGRPSNLQNIEPGRGYVLFMNQPASLQVTGTIRESDLTLPQFNLRQGWNFIGTFSPNQPRDNILSGIGYTDLYKFDPISQDYVLIETNEELNELDGYWIYVDDISTISPVFLAPPTK